MSSISNRIKSFVELGHFLSEISTTDLHKETDKTSHHSFYEAFENAIQRAEQENGWFSSEYIYYALKQWAKILQQEPLEKWMGRYTEQASESKRVAIIMAGNIPLVGFHDFLSVLLTGHVAMVRMSSNDQCFLPLIASYLKHNNSYFEEKIEFIEGKLSGFDMAIATGSNNTARYFDYYLRHKPHIIRKNRNSVAILTGEESPEQLTALGHDIFTYYGLGCRSVSKLFVPQAYDFKAFFEAIYHYHPIIDHKKYANNYEYNKAIYLMSLFKILENGFLMLKEEESYASPIATIFYEYYKSPQELHKKIQTDRMKIQCIVANGFSDDEIAFGATQQPSLSDYADGIDTVDFLLKI